MKNYCSFYMILSSERNYCRTQVWWNGRARLYLSVLPEWTIVRSRVIPCQLTQLIPPDPLQISSNLVYVVIWSEKDKMSNMSAIGRSVCELCHAHFSRFSLKWPRTSIRKRLYLRNLWAKSSSSGEPIEITLTGIGLAGVEVRRESFAPRFAWICISENPCGFTQKNHKRPCVLNSPPKKLHHPIFENRHLSDFERA